MRFTSDTLASIGFVGFRDLLGPSRIQLLCGLEPAYPGHGSATEAALRICMYAFEDLGFSGVEVATDTPNGRSGRVPERLGIRKAQITEDGSDGTVFYVLDRKGCIASKGLGIE